MTHSAIRIHWIIAVAFVLVFRADGIGQNLRVDVVLQQVITTVHDGNGHLVPNLTADDFVVELGRERQSIVHFTRDENVPISVGLVIDASFSMQNAVNAALRAAATFIKGMRVRDEAFLMTFSSGSIVRQDFTSQPALLFEALRGTTLTGGSELIAAVTHAVDKMKNARNSKRALIIISDGGDTWAASNSIFAFGKRLSGMEALVYTVHAQDPKASRASGSTAAERPDLAKMLMETMASESGARYFHVDPTASPDVLADQVTDVFSEIFTELRAQYSIGIYPPDGAKNAGALRVRMVNPSYRVRTVTSRLNPTRPSADDDYEAVLQEAQDLERGGHHSEAIPVYERALALKPSDPRAHRALGPLYAEDKQYQKAADALRLVRQLSVFTGIENYLLAAVLFELNELKDAEETGQKAVTLIPENPQPYLLMFSVYMAEKKLRPALDVLEKYLKLFPNDANHALATERAKQLRSTLTNPPK